MEREISFGQLRMDALDEELNRQLDEGPEPGTHEWYAQQQRLEAKKQEVKDQGVVVEKTTEGERAIPAVEAQTNQQEQPEREEGDLSPEEVRRRIADLIGPREKRAETPVMANNRKRGPFY